MISKLGINLAAISENFWSKTTVMAKFPTAKTERLFLLAIFSISE